MYSEILSKVRTKSEAQYLGDEIDLLLEKIYSTREGGYEEAMKGQVRAWVSELIRAEMEKESIGAEEYLRGLKERLTKLKTIKLTLAFEPSEVGLDKIHEWIRRNVGEGIVFDISINPTLLGGAVIVSGGEYRDYSLRRKLAGTIETKREQIVNILSK